MPPSVSTCCYCGTRAAQVFKGQRAHTLACTSCGAPVGMTPAPKPARRMAAVSRGISSVGSGVATVAGALADRGQRVARGPRRSRLSRIVGGAYDVIDEIFD